MRYPICIAFQKMPLSELVYKPQKCASYYWDETSWKDHTYASGVRGSKRAKIMV